MRRGVGIVLLLAACVACANPRLARVREDTDQYIIGVQYEDARSLVKRLAAFREEIAQRPREEWPSLQARYEQAATDAFAAYEAAKQSGRFPVQDDGIALLQALSVGKGVYYAFEEILLEDGGRHAVARMAVHLDYAPHQFSSLPVDTRVFLVGEPLGTLEIVTVGVLPEQPLRVLARTVLEWRLVWWTAEDVYPEGWAVESVRPLPEATEFRAWEPGPGH